MPSAGVSGMAVTAVTAGGVLLTAAIRNQAPTDVIRAVLKRPTSGKALGTPFASIASGVAQVAGSGASTVGGSALPAAAGAAVLVNEARKHLGAKYVFATAGPVTFDCSGLVVYCLRKTLLPSCPRFTTFTASSVLAKAGWHKVTPAQFQEGDVIIRSGHMGIASASDMYINAPHTGTVVKEVRIPTKGLGWWGYRP